MRGRYRPAGYASQRTVQQLGQIDQAGAPPPIPGATTIIAEDWYTYQIQFQNLTAGSTQTGFIQIEADSDFLIQKLTEMTDINGASQTVTTQLIPICKVVIVDTGSGRQLMNQAVPVSSIFGSGKLPYILPTPKLFVKNSRINVTVENFSAGTDYDNLFLSFEGKKIFTAG
jgi:hypothetical protein